MPGTHAKARIRTACRLLSDDADDADDAERSRTTARHRWSRLATKGEPMDICMLTLEGSRAAEIALEETILVTQGRYAWLHDVNVIRRSALGRLTILASPSKEELRFEYEEGELAERAVETYGTACRLPSRLGPCSCPSATDRSWAVAMLADEVERRFFHTPVFRRLLRRDCSALLLVADANKCLTMVNLFARYQPRVVSRHLHGSASEGLAALDAPDDLLQRASRASTLH